MLMTSPGLTEAMKALSEATKSAEDAVQVKIRAESGKELRRQRRAEARANTKRPKTPNYTEFAFNTLKARRAADPTFRNIRNENGEHV